MSTEAERLALHTGDLDAAGHDTLGGGGGGVTVEEVDGSPTGLVSKIKFPNGSVSIVGAEATVIPAGGGVTAHSALTGLAADDHPQYATDADLTTHAATPHGGGGVTDHGALTGLGDDDHPQYATDTDLTTHAATAHGSSLTVKEEGVALATAAASLDFVGSGVTASGTGADKTITINGATGFIGARVYHNAAVAATGTAHPFNSERFDSDGFHDTVTNNTRLTIPAGMGGKYLVNAVAEWAANATGYRQLGFRVNGTTYIGIDRKAAVTTGGEETRQTATTIYDFAAGDYVELITAQYSGGGSLNVNASGSYTPEFSIVKLDSGKVGAGIGVRAAASTATSMVNGAWTSVAFDGSDLFDTDGFHNPASNNTRVTIPAGLGGKYLITGGVSYVSTASGVTRGSRIRLNGATSLEQNLIPVPAIAGTYGARVPVTTVYDLVPGDYVEVQGYQDSGGNINSSPTETSLSVMRLDSGSDTAAGKCLGVAATTHATASTSSSTPATVDAALAVTFVAPASGRVLVHLSGLYSAASGFNFYWVVLEGSTNMGETMVWSAGSTAHHFYVTAQLLITGLTPGSSHTFKFAHRTNGGGTTSVEGGQTPSVISCFAA